MGWGRWDLAEERRRMLVQAGLAGDAVPPVEELVVRLLSRPVKVRKSRMCSGRPAAWLEYQVAGPTIIVREGLAGAERAHAVAVCLANWWLGRQPGWELCPDRHRLCYALGHAIRSGQVPNQNDVPSLYASRGWLTLAPDGGLLN
jgi:hypothetical protein